MEQHNSDQKSVTPYHMMIGGLIVWWCLSLLFFWNHMGDDAYIFFRYAEHLSVGEGLRWNVGLPTVEGFSSPLWVLCLGVGGIFVDIPIFARWFGLLCLGGAFFELHRTMKPSWFTGCALLSLSLVMGLHYWGTAGLETPLYLWLLLVSLPLLSRSSVGFWNWVALGLLGITRPEAPAIVCLVLCLRWFRFRTWSNKYLLALAPMLGWQLYRLWYFGDWLPNTYWAKASGDLYGRLLSGWNYAGWLLIPLVIGIWKSTDKLVWIPSIALWSIVVVGGGDWMWHHRLLVPVLGIVVYLGWTVEGRWRYALVASMIPYWIKPAMVWAVLGCVWTGKTLPTTEFQEGNLIVVSERLADEIREVYPTDSLIAVNHAGVLPYFLSDYDFLDMSALNDRHLARLEGGLHQKFDAEYVLNQQPDLVVLNSFVDPKTDMGYQPNYWEGETALFVHPRFKEEYVPIAKVWRRVRHGGGFASIWLFQRRKGL